MIPAGSDSQKNHPKCNLYLSIVRINHCHSVTRTVCWRRVGIHALSLVCVNHPHYQIRVAYRTMFFYQSFEPRTDLIKFGSTLCNLYDPTTICIAILANMALLESYREAHDSCFKKLARQEPKLCLASIRLV